MIRSRSGEHEGCSIKIVFSLAGTAMAPGPFVRKRGAKQLHSRARHVVGRPAARSGSAHGPTINAYLVEWGGRSATLTFDTLAAEIKRSDRCPNGECQRGFRCLLR